MGKRQFQRIPYSVEVEFRTASSFLVAYSVNLSRGGIFIETDQELPIGAEIALRFAVPGVGCIELSGEVAWQRPDDGPLAYLPAGIGIRFQAMDPALGAVIDQLVSSYQGVRILIVSTRPQDATTLSRMTRSVMATAVVDCAADIQTSLRHLAGDIDTVIVEADADLALQIIRAAKNRARPVPVLALSATERAKQRARTAGADEVIGSPPAQSEFQASLVRALGRPLYIR
ncbi:MAG: TIGR02266 family protein [Myxococcota bacterium]